MKKSAKPARKVLKKTTTKQSTRAKSYYLLGIGYVAGKIPTGYKQVVTAKTGPEWLIKNAPKEHGQLPTINYEKKITEAQYKKLKKLYAE